MTIKFQLKKFNNNFSLKKKLFWVVALLFLAIVSSIGSSNVFAVSSNDASIETELSQTVNSVVEGIDFSELQSLVEGLDSINILDVSIKDKVKQILKGEYFSNYSSLFSGIMSLVFVDIREVMPLIFTILAIGILSNLLSEFKSDNSVHEIIYFVCLSMMIITIIWVFKDVIESTSMALNSILRQMQILFPILITLLTAIGSLSTISIYNPLVAVLTTIVSVVFDKFLYPMFILMFIICILGNLTNTIKLDKFQGFLGSSFKWIVGIIFTLFAGFLSIQGITAGKYDSVGIKATKFAVKSYIPIIGSYISDGMDFIVLGSVLVKNTIGLVGILILFISIISPVITILVIKLALQFSAAILELSGSFRMSNFVSKSSSILIYPIVLIVGIAFMYIITVALIMCTANIF